MLLIPPVYVMEHWQKAKRLPGHSVCPNLIVDAVLTPPREVVADCEAAERVSGRNFS